MTTNDSLCSVPERYHDEPLMCLAVRPHAYLPPAQAHASQTAFARGILRKTTLPLPPPAVAVPRNTILTAVAPNVSLSNLLNGFPGGKLCYYTAQYAHHVNLFHTIESLSSPKIMRFPCGSHRVRELHSIYWCVCKVSFSDSITIINENPTIRYSRISLMTTAGFVVE